jgi:hypothetical protein
MSATQIVSTNVENQTQFQTYWKFDSQLKHCKNIVDLTEHKIIAFANKQNEYDKARMLTILNQYKNGQIQVMWRKGVPLYTYIDPNNICESLK